MSVNLWECDGCGTTVLCTQAELAGWGFTRHHGNRGGKVWVLVLCDECEEIAKGKGKFADSRAVA
jgi:hypothetical protein